MMVETALECPLDSGTSAAALPPWKRELLQRRAGRPPPAATTNPTNASAMTKTEDDDDEELQYGPGIVKRLKSRYLSLALREAPKRRPSVLRRATSLEHLLERPPLAPRPRPVSNPAPVIREDIRRDAVKRARSVDALSRLDDAPLPMTPVPSGLPPARCRPPLRPAPLLRETERPPPDVVRSTLRKFEPAPPRRTESTTHMFAMTTSAFNSVLLCRSRSSPRRIGVIKPMPAAPPVQEATDTVDEALSKYIAPELTDHERKDPPSAPVEPRARTKEECKTPLANILEKFERRSSTPEPQAQTTESPEPRSDSPQKFKCSKISNAKIERGRSLPESDFRRNGGTSIVFDFSSRKEVPDYIENDGLILKASKKDRLKAGDPGVVVLRPELCAESDGEAPRSPSPLAVRFVNDNVLINGRSSLTTNNKDRIQKLKLQFDDSLTMTFEYPSETSLVDDENILQNNGRSLSSYQPCKSTADTFALGVSRPPLNCYDNGVKEERCSSPVNDARSFSHSRDMRTDLLF